MVKTPPCKSSILIFPSRALTGIFGEVLFDLRKALLVRVPDHRHDEPPLGADCDADVVVMVLDEFVTFQPAIDRQGCP